MARRFALAVACALRFQVAFSALGQKWKLIYQAPAEHARRLQAGESTTIEQAFDVMKADYFSECSKMEICANKNGKQMCLNILGTEGMCSKYLHAYGFKQGVVLKVKGKEATGSELAKAQSEVQAPAGVAASVAAGTTLAGSMESSSILNVESIEVPEVANSAADGQIVGNTAAGTCPANLKVMAVITTTCGESTGLNKGQVETAMFGSGGQSFKVRMEECSGPSAQVSVTGEVHGPIEVCPTEKRNAGATWTAVQQKLQADGVYDSSKYIVILVPDSWLDAIGMGQLCGKITWVRKSYFDKATMHLHEIGHNLCLHHASKNGEEYGDQSSSLGYCCTLRCYHWIHSWQMGWSTVAQEYDISKALGGIVDLHIKEHAKNKDAGIVLKKSNTEQYVLSFRGDEGFDSFLPGEYQNQVFIHKYSHMSDRFAAELTHLEGSAKMGLGTGLPNDGGQSFQSNAKVANTGLQITWWSKTKESWANGYVAHVRLCVGDGSGACGQSTSGPTQRPTLAPETPVWSSYFTESQGSSITEGAMLGVGCQGDFCSSMKTAHSQTILVDLDQKQSIPSTGDVSEMFCGSGAVVSRILCTGANCNAMTVECAPVRGGTLDTTVGGSTESAWIPATAGITAENTCASGSVVTGVMCGGTDCAKVKLRCNAYIVNEQCGAQDGCSALGLECGYNGCGATCGSCINGLSCLMAARRCTSMGVESDWFSSDTDMPKTGITATGLRCKDRYCGSVRVVSMGITVDLSKTSNSGWISDNVGAKWPWNDKADANAADCPDGTVITHIECRNKWCDDLKLTCAPPTGWTVDMTGEPWHGKEWFSEEEESQDCPDGFVMTGLECMISTGILDGCVLKCGDYCDSKKIRCRQIIPSAVGAAALGIASSAELAAAQVPSEPCDEQCRAQKMSLMGVTGGASGATVSLSAFALTSTALFVSK